MQTSHGTSGLQNIKRITTEDVATFELSAGLPGEPAAEGAAPRVKATPAAAAPVLKVHECETDIQEVRSRGKHGQHSHLKFSGLSTREGACWAPLQVGDGRTGT